MHTPADSVQAHACKAIPAKWLVCVALSTLAVFATYWPHALELFRLDRALLFSGEIWRVLTGHVAHMNTPHLLMNLLALFVLCELLWRDLDWRQGLVLILAAALGTTAALLAWHPEVAWYAGLSGALHGLWAGCALHGVCVVRPELKAQDNAVHTWQAHWPIQRRIYAVALALLCIKLLLEFLYGPSQRTMQAIGGSVIAVSHAYGAISGIAYLLLRHVITSIGHAESPRFRLK